MLEIIISDLDAEEKKNELHQQAQCRIQHSEETSRKI